MASNKTYMRIEGLDAALRGLDKISMQRTLSGVVGIVAGEIKNRMATYPIETAANMPGPYPKRWYQRLFGPRWRTKGGSLQGKDTSERLQQSWRQSVTSPLSQLVDTRSPRTGRPVTYAAGVVGEETQQDVHRRHGWHTTLSVAEDVVRDHIVEQRIMAEIDRALQ